MLPALSRTRQQIAARLIAVRKRTQQAQEAVRELYKRFAQKGKTPSKDQLERVQWHILVTSVGKHTMAAKELAKLYAQRWQIEIVFQARK